MIAAQRIRRDINLGTLERLPAWSAGPGPDFEDRVTALRTAEIEGVQCADPYPYVKAGFVGVGMGRVTSASQVAPIVARMIDAGAELTSLHVGTGLESESQMDQLAAAILDVSVRHNHPVPIEIHRATMTQDMRRTVDLVDRFPTLKFTADLAHWYLGQEMPYGDFAGKLAFLEPVFERVRYVHLRLATSGAIQVAVDEQRYPEAIADWRAIHSACLRAFLRNAEPFERMPAAPELLPCIIDVGAGPLRIDYAVTDRDPDGAEREATDRWSEGLELLKMFTALIELG